MLLTFCGWGGFALVVWDTSGLRYREHSKRISGRRADDLPSGCPLAGGGSAPKWGILVRAVPGCASGSLASALTPRRWRTTLWFGLLVRRGRGVVVWVWWWCVRAFVSC